MDMEINNAMQARMALLKETGYNVEKAQKCWDFVQGNNEIKKQELVNSKLIDGVYLIITNGSAIRYYGENTDIIYPINNVAYIGIIQNNHSLAIALRDVCNYENSITTMLSQKNNGYYKNKYKDAMQDWDGKGNTERLKQKGLYRAIQLKDGEYIPTLAELYLIYLNQEIINEAMCFAGGQELKGWYWSSTEYDATKVWNLSFNDDYSSYNNKVGDSCRVRLVSTFLPNTVKILN